MTNYGIKTASANYTGGGIYIYHGELENGLYFSTCDTWESVAICTNPTDTEESQYPEFYEKYLSVELTGDDYRTFWHNILRWILAHAPAGNYSPSDLKERLLTK